MHALPDFDPGFSTPAMRELWSGASRIRRWCEVETALAHATAFAGLIPADSVTALESACAALDVEPGELFAEGWAAGTPILSLCDHLRRRLPPGVAAHLHYGATSQDVIDTGAMLQVRDAYGELTRLLEGTADGLAASIDRNREAWVVGRTLLQPALPTLLAWRLACWLEPVLELLDELAGAVTRLPVQLGGPVGDLSTFGGAGEAVVAAFAERLGLSVPATSWHTNRAPVVAAVELAGRAARVADKVASDLLLLTQDEVGEMTLPAGGSSSMPHKKNALLAVRAVAAARACHGVSSIVLFAPAHELERAAGSWHAEWFALPLVFQTAGAALGSVRDAVTGMGFDAARASENLGNVPVVHRAAPTKSPEDSSGVARLVAGVVARYRRQLEQRRR